MEMVKKKLLEGSWKVTGGSHWNSASLPLAILVIEWVSVLSNKQIFRHIFFFVLLEVVFKPFQKWIEFWGGGETYIFCPLCGPLELVSFNNQKIDWTNSYWYISSTRSTTVVMEASPSKRSRKWSLLWRLRFIFYIVLHLSPIEGLDRPENKIIKTSNHIHSST